MLTIMIRRWDDVSWGRTVPGLVIRYRRWHVARGRTSFQLVRHRPSFHGVPACAGIESAVAVRGLAGLRRM